MNAFHRDDDFRFHPFAGLVRPPSREAALAERRVPKFPVEREKEGENRTNCTSSTSYHATSSPRETLESG